VRKADVFPIFIKSMDVEIDGIGGSLHAETVQHLTAMLMGNKWPVSSWKKFQIALMRSIFRNFAASYMRSSPFQDKRGGAALSPSPCGEGLGVTPRFLVN
jgi:hypothetical protein